MCLASHAAPPAEGAQRGVQPAISHSHKAGAAAGLVVWKQKKKKKANKWIHLTTICPCGEEGAKKCMWVTHWNVIDSTWTCKCPCRRVSSACWHWLVISRVTNGFRSRFGLIASVKRLRRSDLKVLYLARVQEHQCWFWKEKKNMYMSLVHHWICRKLRKSFQLFPCRLLLNWGFFGWYPSCDRTEAGSTPDKSPV